MLNKIVNIIFLINNFLKKEAKMAKIKFPELLFGMSGKYNNVVFSSNKYGGYVKLRKKPTNPKTPEQLETRGKFSQVSKAWGN